jgi:hypothetical protein
MRLIGHLENEKQAFTLYSYLLSEGIHSTYEKEADGFSIWIYEEDEIEKAQALLAEFKSNPSDPKYGKIEFPTAPPQPPDKITEQKEPEKKKLSLPPGARKIRTYPITYFVIFVCVLLYFLNTREQYHMVKEDGIVAAQIGMTPIQQKLMFDYPARSQKINQLLNEQSFKKYKEIKEIPPSTLREALALSPLDWKASVNRRGGWPPLHRHPQRRGLATHHPHFPAWRLLSYPLQYVVGVAPPPPGGRAALSL